MLMLEGVTKYVYVYKSLMLTKSVIVGWEYDFVFCLNLYLTFVLPTP